MFYMFLLSAEAVARAEAPAEAPAAAAAVAQQVEQDHAPAPAHDAARLGVGGLGAVGAAGVLQPLQVHSFLKAHRQPMSLQPNFPQNGMQKPMS